MRAGFVPVLVNTLSPPELVAYFLADSGAEAAIVDARFATLLMHDDVAATRLRQVVHVGDVSADALPPGRMSQEWSAWIGRAGRGTRARGLASRRHGVLDVQQRIDGPAERCRAPASRRALHVDVVWRARARAARRRRGVLAAKDLLRLWIRQLDHVSVRGGRHDGADARPPGAGSRVRGGRAPSPDGALRIADVVHRDGRASRVGSAGPVEPAHVRVGRRTLSPELFAEWRRRYGLSIVEGLGSTEVLHSTCRHADGPEARGERQARAGL